MLCPITEKGGDLAQFTAGWPGAAQRLQAHLAEDEDVQGDSAEAAEDPGGGRAQLGPCVGAQQDAAAVGDIGRDCAPKHGQAQPLRAVPPPIAHDL